MNLKSIEVGKIYRTRNNLWAKVIKRSNLYSKDYQFAGAVFETHKITDETPARCWYSWSEKGSLVIGQISAFDLISEWDPKASESAVDSPQCLPPIQ